MKNKHAFAVIITLLALTFTACKKEDSSSSKSASTSAFAGTYMGSIVVYLGPTGSDYFTTLNNHVMVIDNVSSGKVNISSGNVFMTSLANISGNNLNIPSTYPINGPNQVVNEYGSGTLNGTTLNLDLHQIQTIPGTPGVSHGRWVGTLVRQ